MNEIDIVNEINEMSFEKKKDLLDRFIWRAEAAREVARIAKRRSIQINSVFPSENERFLARVLLGEAICRKESERRMINDYEWFLLFLLRSVPVWGGGGDIYTETSSSCIRWYKKPIPIKYYEGNLNGFICGFCFEDYYWCSIGESGGEYCAWNPHLQREMKYMKLIQTQFEVIRS